MIGDRAFGTELGRDATPLEAGLGWIVKLDKGDFIGREAIAGRKEKGARERLVGFAPDVRGVNVNVARWSLR